jgi:hypothetical protein
MGVDNGARESQQGEPEGQRLWGSRRISRRGLLAVAIAVGAATVACRAGELLDPCSQNGVTDGPTLKKWNCIPRTPTPTPQGR